MCDIDFAPDGTAWVGSDQSLWVTTDNGLTFTHRDLGLGTYTYTYAVKVDPGKPQVIWAGTSGDGVIKTLDGGTTWTNVTPSGASGSCWGIAINTTNSSQVMVVYGGGFGGGGV